MKRSFTQTYLLSLVMFLMVSVNGSTQELSYFSGAWSTQYYKDNQEIEKSKFENLLMANTKSYDLWLKHKKQSTIGTVFVVGELASFVWMVSELSNGRNAVASSLATVGFAGVAIWVLSKALKNKREAVLNYNQSLIHKTSFRIIPSKSGLGILLTF